MPDECHAILKQYAALLGRSMSDIMYDFAKQEIQQHAKFCPIILAILIQNSYTPDKRKDKPCWGHSCFICKHYHQCLAGLYKETFEPKNTLRIRTENNGLDHTLKHIPDISDR